MTGKKRQYSKLIEVDLSSQTMRAVEGGREVFAFDCVTGSKDHPTEPGQFRILRKSPNHVSKAYNAAMHWALFFTTDGKAFHQYHGVVPLSIVRAFKENVTDLVGSHGCVRHRGKCQGAVQLGRLQDSRHHLRQADMKPQPTIAALLLIGCRSTPQQSPGEIDSVAPDVVLTFEYETPAFRVSAHRFNVHDPFEVVVQRPGHPLRRCVGDKSFDDEIAPFEALVSKRLLPEEEAAKLKPKRPFHRLRFATEPPLDAFDDVLSPLPSGALSLMREGVTHELTLTTATVERLAKICQ